MLPNFLLIGAPRSGTTSTYEGLKQHPQIYLSRLKEPMFFILEGEKEFFPGPQNPIGPRNWTDYCSLFADATREKAVGEASTFYLFSPKSPGRIKEYLPDVKLMAILRNPVDRAYSHFLTNRLAGTEPIADFEEAMQAEEERLRKGWFLFWSYRGMGFYGRQIERYYSYFDRGRFRFFLFEDLLEHPKNFFAEIFRFLGVDEKARIRLPGKYNSSGVPRSPTAHTFLTQPNFIKTQLKRILPDDLQYRFLAKSLNLTLVKPPLHGEVRSRILDMYREDILKTQDLLHRDLSRWMSPGQTED